MALVGYQNRPLILPHNDGDDDYAEAPLLVSKRLDFAERFRRQGIRLCFSQFQIGCSGSLPKSEEWGVAWSPAILQTQVAQAKNWRFWYGTSDSRDMSDSKSLPASWIPHPYWRWRIVAEPEGVSASLGEVGPCTDIGGSYDSGSTIYQGTLTKEGVLTGMPDFAVMPISNPVFTRNLQLSVVRDGDLGTEEWLCPVWN